MSKSKQNISEPKQNNSKPRENNSELKCNNVLRKLENVLRKHFIKNHHQSSIKKSNHVKELDELIYLSH